MHQQLSPVFAPHGGKEVLILVSQVVKEGFGYLPEEAISEIADFLCEGG